MIIKIPSLLLMKNISYLVDFPLLVLRWLSSHFTFTKYNRSKLFSRELLKIIQFDPSLYSGGNPYPENLLDLKAMVS